MLGFNLKAGLLAYIGRFVFTIFCVWVSAWGVANYVVNTNIKGTTLALATIRATTEQNAVDNATALQAVIDSVRASSKSLTATLESIRSANDGSFKALQSSTDTALKNLQASIDRLNQTVIANNKSMPSSMAKP